MRRFGFLCLVILGGLILDCDGEMILYNEFFAIKRKHLGQKEYIFSFTV